MSGVLTEQNSQNAPGQLGSPPAVLVLLGSFQRLPLSFRSSTLLQLRQQKLQDLPWF